MYVNVCDTDMNINCTFLLKVHVHVHVHVCTTLVKMLYYEYVAYFLESRYKQLAGESFILSRCVIDKKIHCNEYCNYCDLVILKGRL